MWGVKRLSISPCNYTIFFYKKQILQDIYISNVRAYIIYIVSRAGLEPARFTAEDFQGFPLDYVIAIFFNLGSWYIVSTRFV